MTESLTWQIMPLNSKGPVRKHLRKPQRKYPVGIGKRESFESKNKSNYLLYNFPLLSFPYNSKIQSNLKEDYLIVIYLCPILPRNELRWLMWFFLSSKKFWVIAWTHFECFLFLVNENCLLNCVPFRTNTETANNKVLGLHHLAPAKTSHTLFVFPWKACAGTPAKQHLLQCQCLLKRGCSDNFYLSRDTCPPHL